MQTADRCRRPASAQISAGMLPVWVHTCSCIVLLAWGVSLRGLSNHTLRRWGQGPAEYLPSKRWRIFLSLWK
ncbi:hypothetical protein CGCTS75_v009539 [Colletotrichum tropicale]|nr:hypothetical protein CGCTS75_v009539 [Colletotrichum tropicale]